jgi:hypothetical protein
VGACAALVAFGSVAGCDGSPDAADVADPGAARSAPDLGPPPEGDDLGELLTDVAHLVDSSRANHAALENEAAWGDWSRAWSILGRYHIERLRAVDPLAALQIEYGFGRLRQALEDTRGNRAALQRSKDLAAQLVAQIDAHRGALTAIAPSVPATSPEATAPTP